MLFTAASVRAGRAAAARVLLVLRTSMRELDPTEALPSSSPLATAPARAALPSHHTLSHSTQSVSNLGIFPSSETTLSVPSSLLASEETTLRDGDEALRLWPLARGAPVAFFRTFRPSVYRRRRPPTNTLYQ